jgi:hypothetical protein
MGIVVDFNPLAGRNHQPPAPTAPPGRRPQLPMPTQEDLAERRHLPGPEEDLAALCGGRLQPGRLLPLPTPADLARIREQIKNELGPPATWDDAVAALHMIRHKKAEDGVNIDELIQANIEEIVDSNVPVGILWQAVREARRERTRFPDPAWMHAKFVELQRPYSDWLHQIVRIEAEQNRRAREDAERAAERRARLAKHSAWIKDVQRRMAAAGDPPDLLDIEFGTHLQPCLRRGDSWISWQEFADQDALAAVALCRRLAQIALSDFDRVPHAEGLARRHAEALATALLEAGFAPPTPPSPTLPPQIGRQRPPEQDWAPRRPLAELTAGYRLVDADNPEVQRWMRLIEEA